MRVHTHGFFFILDVLIFKRDSRVFFFYCDISRTDRYRFKNNKTNDTKSVLSNANSLLQNIITALTLYYYCHCYYWFRLENIKSIMNTHCTAIAKNNNNRQIVSGERKR